MTVQRLLRTPLSETVFSDGCHIRLEKYNVTNVKMDKPKGVLVQ